jgi:hypothetical protein
VKAIHPDAFVEKLMRLSENKVALSLLNMHLALKKPPLTIDELKERLKSLGLVSSMSNLHFTELKMLK